MAGSLFGVGTVPDIDVNKVSVVRLPKFNKLINGRYRVFAWP